MTPNQTSEQRQCGVNNCLAVRIYIFLSIPGSVWSNWRIKSTGPCVMDLTKFPMDSIECSLTFESFNYNKVAIFFNYTSFSALLTLSRVSCHHLFTLTSFYRANLNFHFHHFLLFRMRCSCDGATRRWRYSSQSSSQTLPWPISARQTNFRWESLSHRMLTLLSAIRCRLLEWAKRQLPIPPKIWLVPPPGLHPNLYDRLHFLDPILLRPESDTSQDNDRSVVVYPKFLSPPQLLPHPNPRNSIWWRWSDFARHHQSSLPSFDIENSSWVLERRVVRSLRIDEAEWENTRKDGNQKKPIYCNLLVFLLITVY